MHVQAQFPAVHWIWEGAISFVYEVHPRIVVKVPTTGEYEREQFHKEVKTLQKLAQSPPCPFIVDCYYHTDIGIFLEYMRDGSLSSRIQYHQIKDKENSAIVTQVKKLEPLALRKTWMNNLAQAAAFLESHNLAHGDLRPENILLDRDQLKLSDFDCTAEIGAPFEACMAPYGRLLNSQESDQGRKGTSGQLGARTEQFALGSLFYFINYGFEVHGDCCLTKDPRERGPKLVDLLQDFVLPRLDGRGAFFIDRLIDNCWHNRYTTIAKLAAETESLLQEQDIDHRPNLFHKWRKAICLIGHKISAFFKSCWAWMLGRPSCPTGPEAASGNSDQLCLPQDISQKHVCLDKTAYCQDLEQRGLLDLLASGEPADLGFGLEYYRYQCLE